MAAPKIKSLSQGYIFYNRLKDNPDPEKSNLFDIAQRGVDEYISFYKDKEKNVISANLLAMSSIELEKEKAALSKIFDLSLSVVDLNDPQQIKMLIDAFNATLGLKSAYERNIKRIKYYKKEQINIASFFSGYFISSWNENKDHIISKMYEMYDISNDSSVDNMLNYLKEQMRVVAKEAFKKMLSSKDISEDPETLRGYSSLLPIFDQFSGTNKFTQEMAKIYQLDYIAEQLSQILINDRQKDSAINKINEAVNFNIKKGYYSKGGLVLEQLENYVASAIMSGLVGNPNVQVKMSGVAHSTGNLGMKADNIFTFGIDFEKVNSILESMKHQQVNRENITKSIANLQKELSEVSEGFIIYSSAKNYISQAGSFDGFSGGAPVSVRTMRNITDDKTKMGAILQTVNGAVGADQREDIKLSIAEDIAYYLFDDFQTIGTPSSGAQALHLFDLDGIYVPLSVLLFKLGSAINYVRKVPTSLLTVNIHNPPNILYESDKEMPEEAWEKQRQDAADNTKISVAFMKDFFSMIRSF